MELVETPLINCYELRPSLFKDQRGRFVKTLQKNIFIKLNLVTEFDEEYYTFSHRNVLRGLHFQTPPFEHTKIVYCVYGEILDAIVDLRRSSGTYGRYHTVKLSADNCKMLYVSSGVAHGFYALQDSIVMYKVTSEYNAKFDKGIRWDSVDIPWPSSTPILSERDKKHIVFQNFITPFS